jgi:hypothetical protein
MPWVGFEPKIPVFQRATTVHVLDRAATVIGIQSPYMSTNENTYYYLPIYFKLLQINYPSLMSP